MARLDSLVIHSASHEYPIYIGYELLSDVELLRRHVDGTQVFIVTNDVVAPLYLARVKQAFAGFKCDEIILADGEMHKNQASLLSIYDALIAFDHHRDTTLVALGGGVIGDMTGCAASTYQRGVKYLQLPTTLLAQVDASIGGKTAINHSLGKNMIGSFYQPHAVFIDVKTLSTLPTREFRSGLAEVIKYGLLMGGDFLTLLAEALLKGLDARPTEQLLDIISHCCHIKATIVQDDERENGRRALLNLGHTFAHALEAYTRYQRWTHGEAVAIGLYCAVLLSCQMSGLDPSALVLIDSLLRAAKLPSRIPKDIDLIALQTLMLRDKKIKNNKLRFVLIRAPGDCYLESKVTADCLHQVLLSAVEGD